MASQNWKLQGDYFEGCTCDSICPCLFLSDPDNGFCNVTVAWHVEKGHYDDIQLDGLNAVAVFENNKFLNFDVLNFKYSEISIDYFQVHYLLDPRKNIDNLSYQHTVHESEQIPCSRCTR